MKQPTGKYGGVTHPQHGCATCHLPIFNFDGTETRCRECIIASGDTPATVGDFRPWYTLITEEERQRILAKHSSSGRTRWLEEDVEIPKVGCVVNVAYQKVSGGELVLMAGKVIPHASYGLIFYHAWDGVEPFHRNTNCPCPIDTVIPEFMQVNGIKWYYGYDVQATRLWKIDAASILEAPAMEYAKETVRQRFFPDKMLWESLGDVHQQQKGKDKVLIKGEGTKNLVLSVPFIAASATVTLRHVPKF